MLSKSVDEIEIMEKTAVADLKNLQLQVKQRSNKAVSSKSPEMRELLMTSIRQRRKLNMLTKKKNALAQHLDTLQSSSLNQQVIASVKQTSSVLKQLGLDEQIESVDAIMMDLNESMQDTDTIQKSLSASIEVDSSDDSCLQRELELLMNGDWQSENDVVVAAPKNTNKMKEVTQTKKASPEKDMSEPIDDSSEKHSESILA